MYSPSSCFFLSVDFFTLWRRGVTNSIIYCNLIRMKFLPYVILISQLFSGCRSNTNEPIEVQQWTTFEFSLTSATVFTNPYTDISVWAIFTNGRGDSLVRPAFWDGDKTWKVRFSPPDVGTVWAWSTHADKNAPGLADQTGSLKSIPYAGTNGLLKHGLLQMSPGKRNVVRQDGRPFLVVGDTPWAIPFRATN